MVDKNILFQKSAAARRFLEQVWPEWQAQTCREFRISLPHIMSANTCGRSSLFLAAVMNEAGIKAQIEHGWFCKTDPVATEAEIPRHAWVTADSWIIDITADQFGSPPVLLTGRDDARYRPGTDTADAAARARRSDALAAVWEQWLARYP